MAKKRTGNFNYRNRKYRRLLERFMNADLRLERRTGPVYLSDFQFDRKEVDCLTELLRRKVASDEAELRRRLER